MVIAGFIVGVACSLIGSQIEGEFGPLVSQRVAVASGLAFLVSQLTDIAIFNRLRRQGWWRAPLYSPMVSSVLDTSIMNLALPDIGKEMNASAAHAVWVVNAYQLATLVLLR